jgi:hypothetical protein
MPGRDAGKNTSVRDAGRNMPGRDAGRNTSVRDAGRNMPPAVSSHGGGRSPDIGRPGTRMGDGRSVGRNNPPPRIYRNPSGTEAHIRSDGRIDSVHARGMTINHGPGGRMVVHRPDRSVIVTNRAGHGYVQRPFSYRGHEMVHRTYYVRGVAYARYYRPYNYRGIVLHGYVPVRYYSPGFYGWVYHPWARPVSYGWGWGGSPWYGYYGGYFAPAPYYPSPALWLADYLISQQLMAAYQERANAAAMQQQQQNFAGNQMTPEIKDAIAMEVQRQLTLENQESQLAARHEMGDPASNGIPRLLNDNKPHVFIVSYNLEVTDSAGQVCSLSRGDVLRLDSPPPPDATAAYVQVAASKGIGCPRGSTVAVELTDLQDMHNQMRESLNQGMSELQTRAGQNGLPALPVSAAAPPVAAPFADVAPPPDPNVASVLSQEVQDVDRVEQEVLGEAKVSVPPPQDSAAAPPPPTPAAPQTATISLGQTPAEVVTILGNPLQIVKLGNKEIYRYKDIKITFVSGKVTDVQ